MTDVLGAAIKTWCQAYEHFRTPAMTPVDAHLERSGLGSSLSAFGYYDWQQQKSFIEASWSELSRSNTVTLEEFGRYIHLEAAGLKWLSRLMGMFADMTQIFRMHNHWTGSRLFRMLTSRTEEHADGRLFIRVDLAERCVGSKLFFELCSLSTPYIAVAAGHEKPRVVERRFSDRHFELLLHPIGRRRRRGKAPTEQLNLVEEILSSQQQNYDLSSDFRNVFNSVPDGLMVLDEKKIADCNAAFCRIVGVEAPRDLVHKDIQSVLTTTSIDRFDEWLIGSADDIVLEGVKVESGAERVVELTRGGTLKFDFKDCSLVVARDLTANYTMEKLLQRQYKLASIGKLSASISHEINTPLTVVSSNLQLILESGQVEPAVAANAREALQEVNRIRHVTANLLNLVRTSESQSRVSLRGVVEESLRVCRSLARSCKVDLRLDETSLDDAFDGHRLDVLQILTILIINAIEATAGADERWVKILTARSYDRYIIYVSDSGPGIAPEIRDRIFEPLVTTKAQGTGLGLSIASEIAAKNNFELALESPSQPTTFKLTL